MMASLPKKGTKVTWGTAQGETEGTVEKTVTKSTKLKGHTAKATKEEPQLMVKSSKSGKTAIHKPEDLEKA
jgi:threonine dehydrogenase-like Zn-dependent dehydrogenase